MGSRPSRISLSPSLSSIAGAITFHLKKHALASKSVVDAVVDAPNAFSASDDAPASNPGLPRFLGRVS